MIAYLAESMPLQNNTTFYSKVVSFLKAHDIFKDTDLSDDLERQNLKLTDGKPGNWFLFEYNDMDCFCYSYSVIANRSDGAALNGVSLWKIEKMKNGLSLKCVCDARLPYTIEMDNTKAALLSAKFTRILMDRLRRETQLQKMVHIIVKQRDHHRFWDSADDLKIVL